MLLYGWDVLMVLGKVLLAISVHILVKAQKYGGLCDHTMSNLKGKAKRGSDKPLGGSTTMSSKVACWLSETL